jgi:hypothetical protein
MASPRILCLVVACCLLFAACGDDDSASSTTTAAPSTDDVGDSDGGGDDSGEMDDDAVDDGETDDGDMGDGDMGEGDMNEQDPALVGPYCALSSQADVRSAAFDPAATPAEAEEFYRSMLALTDQGLETAPASVADSLGVQRDVLVQTIAVLEAGGWDLLGSIDQLTPIYEDPEFLAADDTLEEFDVEVCGFAPDEESPEPVPPVDEPIDVPAELAAYCAASFAASEADELAFDADATETEAYYRGLLASVTGLSAVGPPELAADLETIRSNFAEVVSILEGAEWDLDIGFPLVQEWASDPAVTDAMDAAIDRVEAFDAEVCGIVY